MTTPDLLAQLNFARFCILTNCEGISDGQALLEPTKDGNPANRIAGHDAGGAELGQGTATPSHVDAR